MQTLEALQRDINAATDLQSIVRTMKVLAAVSIRQYERALESLADYNRTVEMGLQVVLHNHQATAACQQPRQSPCTGAIVFGSDHGLCGRYNESIAAFALEKLDKIEPNLLNWRLLAVGGRIDAALRERGHNVLETFFVPGSVSGITATVQKMLLQIDDWQSEGVEQVLLFYNAHHQRTTYSARLKKLLPLDLCRFNYSQANPWPSRTLPQFSMDSEKLLSALIRQHLFIVLYSACAESLAGEHASRLVSMQIAEKNIKDRLESITATFRQQRQNEITEELLDVISGFETLKKN